jgi:hypothetical protein
MPTPRNASRKTNRRNKALNGPVFGANELFRTDPITKAILPNTRIPIIRAKVLAEKALQKKRAIEARKKQKAEETEFRKRILSQLKAEFAIKKRQHTFRGGKFIDYLQYVHNMERHASRATEVIPDNKEAAEFFDRKLKVIDEEIAKIRMRTRR